ncbi:hypothetical protein PhCBS80983_g02709 [Powellomyces hirtus]|uniref:Ubiquitin-like domain-containing protein n=1 Tax=Powellomyces hirtus TaxID=109895 RepID=A0A507E7I3_9FUNG|nr:hypothetical protein PhCBS80983_g02709 [Powellomyces hirtus]
MADFTRSAPATVAAPMPPPSPTPQRSFSPHEPGAFPTRNPHAAALNGAAIEKEFVPAAASARTTKVSIRCPTYPSETFSVTVSIDATIVQLKQAVTEVVPGRPAVNDMRLIHAGKLLTDALSVREHLKPDLASPPIVHLVVKGTQGPAVSSPVSPPPAHAADPPSGTTPSTNELRQRHVFEPAAPANEPAQVVHQSAVQRYGQPIFQYPPQYQVVMINGLPYAMQVPAMHPAYPHQAHVVPDQPQFVAAPANATPVPADVAAPDVPVPAAPVAAAAAAALPAQVDNEFGDAQRDVPQNPFWLLLKLTFLVYIFSSNWSLTKIVIMNLITLVIFVVQTRRRAMPPGNNANDATPSATTPTESTPAAPPSPPQSPSVPHLAYMFFASLVPDGHQDAA